MSIRYEFGLRADGKVVAVGGKAFVPNDYDPSAHPTEKPNRIGRGYPAVGSNQAGNVKKALGTLRLVSGAVEFVAETADGFSSLAEVEAADTATGTD